MVEVRWIQASLFLLLMPHVTAAGGESLYVTVRRGDDVTLPCGDAMEHQNRCDRTDWIYYEHTTGIHLVKSGAIHQEDGSVRLSLTEKCSLVIEKVTDQDVGVYVCRQQGQHTSVDLFVVTLTEQYLRVTVRRGDDVTLPCGDVMEHQDQCDRTTWLFTGSGRSSVRLFKRGKIHEDKSAPVRLRVTEKCSLVIEKVTDQNVGRYTCRQFDESERQQGGDAQVDLSVVSNSEHQNNDEVTLSCFMRTHGPCRHTVKWLNEPNSDVTHRQSQSYCSATVTFTTSQLQTLSDSLKCEATDGDGRKQTFPYRRQTSGENAKTPTTTTNTSKPQKTTTEEKNEDASTSSSSTKPQGFPHVLRSVVVSVGLASLIISVVAVNVWTRTKGKNTQMEENSVCDDGDEVNYENAGFSSASV